MLFSKLIKEVSAFSDLIDGGKKGPVFAKIGFSLMPRTAKIKNKLLVGEAAGFSEADRGFGMHYALESGFLAAKSLMEGLDYDELWIDSFINLLNNIGILLKLFGSNVVVTTLTESLP